MEQNLDQGFFRPILGHEPREHWWLPWWPRRRGTWSSPSRPWCPEISHCETMRIPKTWRSGNVWGSTVFSHTDWVNYLENHVKFKVWIWFLSFFHTDFDIAYSVFQGQTAKAIMRLTGAYARKLGYSHEFVLGSVGTCSHRLDPVIRDFMGWLPRKWRNARWDHLQMCYNVSH